MSRILVPPEVLIRVSDEAARAAEELETIKSFLDQQIRGLMASWDGTASARFFVDFQRINFEMNKTIEQLRIISQDLKSIALRFIQADESIEYWNTASAASNNTEVNTFQDHAEDFWQGFQSGAKSIGSSLIDTATSLVEDPLSTVGDMAYNATIGTAEEIIDTAVWGGKMIFDANTREKFAEDVEDSGGTSNYLGQQAAVFLAGLTTRRIGLKAHPNFKHDSGGDGGKSAGGMMGTGVSHETIINSATQAKKGGETVVGHALQKHAGRNPEIWGKVKGGSDQINQTAKKHLEEIINAPGDFVKVTNDRGITFLEKKLPDGRGVRLNKDGTFKGFIDQ